MANRKQQNLEIERQLKKRKFASRIIAFVVIAVLVAAIVIGIWTVQDRRWIMRYDGGRVAAADFRAFWHVNFENNPAAREAAMTSLQGITLLRDRAIEHGVDFTPEEREEAEFWAAAMRAEHIHFNQFDAFYYITDARLAELFHTSSQFARLVDIYEPHYDLDEEEFADLWDEHIEENLHDYWDIQVNIFVSQEPEEIEEALLMLELYTFEEVMRMLNDWMDDDTEIEPMPLTGEQGLMGAFQQMFISPDDTEHVLALQEGETSHRIDLFDMELGNQVFVLVNVLSRDDDIDIDELRVEYREAFIWAGRSALFEERVMGWIDDANFVINQRGYNTTVWDW